MKAHTQTLPPALQRVEKTAPLQKPDNFTFSPDQSTELIQFLNDSVKIFDRSNLNLRVRLIFTSKQVNANDQNENNQNDEKEKKDVKIKLIDIYLPIVNKFLNINPPLAPFTELLKSKELITMLQFVTWVVIFDIIDKSYKTEALEDTRRMIYDRLSIDFSQLQLKLTNSTLSLSGRFIDLWSSVVCATIFTLILTPYEDSQLYRNSSFALRIENDVRMLLIGFASPNVRDFHKSILGLMPSELKIAVPTIVTVGGEDYNPTDFTNALKYEPQIVEAWNQRNNALFQGSSTTGLMKNAMKLKGAQITLPTGKIGRSVKRGNVEKSGMPIAKAKIVLLNADKITSTYKEDSNNIVNDICATEETYTAVPSTPPLTQLGVSFEGFGKKGWGSPQLPHPPTSKTSSIGRAPRSARNMENLDESTIDQIQNNVNELNTENQTIINTPPVRFSRKSNRTSSTTVSYQKRITQPGKNTKERPPGSPRFKYRKVPDIPEIISSVSNINDYLAANPIFDID
ncbi:hypothetical protein M9Y10_022162 [Tritrichomonas musculus]|uniref:Uncharacterized protein n=1 Tax=Tritrichomonas musculus TaxID=1915356 RepID=A0ABR2KSD1_9EUKA